MQYIEIIHLLETPMELSYQRKIASKWNRRYCNFDKFSTRIHGRKHIFPYMKWWIDEWFRSGCAVWAINIYIFIYFSRREEKSLIKCVFLHTFFHTYFSKSSCINFYRKFIIPDRENWIIYPYWNIKRHEAI